MLHLTNNGEYGIDSFPKSSFIIWVYFIRLQTEIIHLKMGGYFCIFRNLCYIPTQKYSILCQRIQCIPHLPH